MPAKNGVWREQRAELSKQFASEYFAFHGQPSALIIVEQDSFVAEFLFENSILSHQILDDGLLLAVDPTRENDETELPGLKNKCHVRAAEEMRYPSTVNGSEVTVKPVVKDRLGWVRLTIGRNGCDEFSAPELDRLRPSRNRTAPRKTLERRFG